MAYVAGVLLEVTVVLVIVTPPVVPSRWFWNVKAFESNPDVATARDAAPAVLVAEAPAVQAA